jgi:hypothetical protein
MNYHPAAFERAADSTRGVSIHGWGSSCGAMLPMMDNFRPGQDRVYESSCIGRSALLVSLEVWFLRVKFSSRLIKVCKDNWTDIDYYVIASLGNS